jgi:hypothetical protein
MALTSSEIIVCNLALGLIGEYQISANSTGSKQYELCERFYYYAVRETLCDHNWNEARKRAFSVESSEAPLFGYEHKFPLPTDCLKVVRLGDNNDWYDWEIEGDYIYTDYTEDPTVWAEGIDFVAGQYCTLSDVTYLCNTAHTSATATSPATDTTTWTTQGGDYAVLRIEYIYHNTDRKTWSPHLLNCITQNLAKKLIVPLTNNQKNKDALTQEYEGLSLKKARSIDAAQGKPKKFFKSRWWNSRESNYYRS